MQQKLKNIFYIIFIFFIFFLLAEISIRIFKKPSPFKFDKVLGWKTKENFNQTFKEKDAEGNEYEVNYITNKIGLRFFGENENNSKKILVIGDSHTMGKYTSNKDMWFSILAKKLTKHYGKNYFVYAGGANGYGSFQEYLLAKDIRNYIKPDIFILQFCENDYVENHLVWDRQISGRNTYLRRPYYSEKKKIKYNENIFSILYRNSIITNSKILNKLGILVEIQERKFFPLNNNVNMKVVREESKYVTLNLVSKIRELFTESRSYIVNCNANMRKDEIIIPFSELAKNAGYILIESPPNKVELMRENRKLFNKDGAHLSPLGNKIYGEELAKKLILLDQ